MAAEHIKALAVSIIGRINLMDGTGRGEGSNQTTHRGSDRTMTGCSPGGKSPRAAACHVSVRSPVRGLFASSSSASPSSKSHLPNDPD